MDIGLPAAVSELKERYFAHFDSIDMLINAAVVAVIKSFDELSEKEFMKVLQFNLSGPFLLLKAFLPKMIEQKKRLIINIPGILGKIPMAGSAAYSESNTVLWV